MTNPQEPREFELRTYKMRKSRVTASQATAIDAFGSQYLIADDGSMIDGRALTQRERFVIEVGFGMGEATVELAKAQPQLGVLAIDVHTPGVGRLIHELAENNIDYVRLFEGNGLALIEKRIADADLDGIRLFFPDPWQKARHHKRRFVTAENMTSIAPKVRSGGFFHFATDWENYAEQATEVLVNHRDWELLPIGNGVEFAQPAERPRTRFEQRGLDQGRSITDLVAIRR